MERGRGEGVCGGKGVAECVCGRRPARGER